MINLDQKQFLGSNVEDQVHESLGKMQLGVKCYL